MLATISILSSVSTSFNTADIQTVLHSFQMTSLSWSSNPNFLFLDWKCTLCYDTDRWCLWEFPSIRSGDLLNVFGEGGRVKEDTSILAGLIVWTAHFQLLWSWGMEYGRRRNVGCGVQGGKMGSRPHLFANWVQLRCQINSTIRLASLKLSKERCAGDQIWYTSTCTCQVKIWLLIEVCFPWGTVSITDRPSKQNSQRNLQSLKGKREKSERCVVMIDNRSQHQGFQKWPQVYYWRPGQEVPGVVMSTVRCQMAGYRIEVVSMDNFL